MKEISRERWPYRPLMEVVIDEEVLTKRINNLTDTAMRRLVKKVDEEATAEINRIFASQEKSLLETIINNVVFSKEFIDKLSQIISLRLKRFSK
jgi:hypothetical protein